jgi:hypothetical protein
MVSSSVSREYLSENQKRNVEDKQSNSKMINRKHKQKKRQKKPLGDGKRLESFRVDSEVNPEECPICLEEIYPLVEMMCSHRFCESCTCKMEQEKEKKENTPLLVCPLCRQPFARSTNVNFLSSSENYLAPRHALSFRFLLQCFMPHLFNLPRVSRSSNPLEEDKKWQEVCDLMGWTSFDQENSNT